MQREYRKIVAGRQVMLRLHLVDDGSIVAKYWQAINAGGKISHWREVASTHTYLLDELSQGFAKDTAEFIDEVRNSRHAQVGVLTNKLGV